MRLTLLHEAQTAKFSKLMDYVKTGHAVGDILWWIDGGKFHSQPVEDSINDTHPKLLGRDPDFRGRYEPNSKKLVIFTRSDLHRVPSTIWKY